MRGALIFLLSLTTVAVATVAVAQPIERTEDELAVAKVVKRAERAGFEKHDTAGYLAAFLPTATFTYGRARAPDAYDYTLDFARQSALAAFRHQPALAGKEGAYFSDEKFTLTADSGAYFAVVERHFFGGIEMWARQYTMKKTADGWRVAALRSWPIRQVVGGEPRMFDEATLKRADEEVDQAIKDGNFILTFTALVMARRMTEARALAEKAVAANPKDAQGQVGLCFMLIEFGEIEAARAVAAKAAKLNSAIPTPFSK